MHSNRPTAFFPCAHKVAVIEVGADTADLNDQLRTVARSMRRARRKEQHEPRAVSQSYIERISMGMTFADDAVREMAPYMLPYSEKSIYEAFDTAEFLSRTEKVSYLPGGRFNVQGCDNRHLSCNFRKTAVHKLKPIKRQIMKRAMEMHKQGLEKEAAQVHNGNAKTESVFITEGGSLCNDQVAAAGKQENQWDEYLVSILSKPTAQWIVSQKTSPHDSRHKVLNDVMVTRHGLPTSMELVEDDMSDSDVTEIMPTVLKDSQRNTKSARLLRSVTEDQEKSKEETVPYSDNTKASFYRLPAGIKKELKAKQRAKEGAQNSTAANIVVVRKEPPPPPKLKDFVNPVIQTTVYDTDNMFERDWLTGNAIVHQQFTDQPEVIIMENLNKYEKQLQPSYPRSPSEWVRTKEGGSSGTADAAKAGSHQHLKMESVSDTTFVHKLSKGLRRWTELPKPIEEADLGVESADQEVSQQGEGVATTTTKPAYTEALFKAADEWRNKWHMNARFSDATQEDLIRDMADIHPHVRMKAVATCAMAANYKPPPVVGIALSGSKGNSDYIDRLSPRIFMALECLLTDNNDKVRLAAAITLHTLNRPLAKAKEVLRTTIKPDQNPADRWAAVQCLGFYGENDSEVIGEVIAEMMQTEDMLKYEKSASLMAHISQTTPLVHSMLGEQLNDCSWRRRVMACKCLPKLHGELNRDLQNKLVHLLWSDGESEVRHAAGQALGKCGHAKLVHDRLRDALNGIVADGNIAIYQTDKVEALNKIGFLGLMTVQLLPPFIRCFRDEYVSIREASCKTAGKIKVKDPSIVCELVRLASLDPIWRIKAQALQALGRVGYVDNDVRDCLLWALRFETEAGVRAEACHAITALQLRDKEVLDTLQNHTLVEQDELVRRELAIALELNGISATEDMEMVAQIKREVRRLCNRDDVYRSILQLEKEEDRKYNTERMLFAASPSPPPATPTTEVDEQSVLQQQQVGGSTKKHLITSEVLEVKADDNEEMAGSNLPVSPRRLASNGAPRSQRRVEAGSKAGQRPDAISLAPRPASGTSSFQTEVVDREIEEIISRADLASRLSSDRKSQKSVLDTPRPPTTGLAKKSVRLGTPGAPSALEVTPNLLSMALDHTLTFHEEMAYAELSLLTTASNLTQAKGFDSQRMHLTGREQRQTGGDNLTMELPTADQQRLQHEDSDPVQFCRRNTEKFLFERYVHIDITTPDTLSSLSSLVSSNMLGSREQTATDSPDGRQQQSSSAASYEQEETHFVVSVSEGRIHQLEK